MVLGALASAGYHVTTGVLNRGDIDWNTAENLGIEIIATEPFCHISQAEIHELHEELQKADIIVIVATDVGQGNIQNLMAASDYLRKKEIVILNPGKEYTDLDFTPDNMATTLYTTIASAAHLLHSVDELLVFLKEMPNSL